MKPCPRCGAMLLVTSAGEKCPNCGWATFTTVRVSNNAVNLPLIIPEEPLETHLLETDIDVILTRISALEVDMERLKEIIKERNEESKSQEKSKKDNLTLKPCPFCGSVDIHTYEPTVYEVGNDASVECQNPICGAEIRADDLRVAIARWNRRARE